MFKWKAPKTEPSEEELKQNIPELKGEYFKGPYWYVEGAGVKPAHIMAAASLTMARMTMTLQR